MALLKDIEIDDYTMQCVNLVPEAIEEEFVRCPADIAYWNERLARALKELLLAKQAREQVGARLHLELKARASLEGKDTKVKPPTVDDLNAAVEVAPEYQAAKLREIEAEVDKARAWGVVEALRVKRDMLVQLGARQRIEMENDPVIRARFAGK
jgi:hypothetical protein